MAEKPVKKPGTRPTDRMILLELRRQGKVLKVIVEILDNIWQERRP